MLVEFTANASKRFPDGALERMIESTNKIIKAMKIGFEARVHFEVSVLSIPELICFTLLYCLRRTPLTMRFSEAQKEKQ